MGIALSRARCEAPAWFPTDEFRTFIKSTRRHGLIHEHNTLRDLSDRLRALPFVGSCNISRKRFLGIFSQVVANVQKRQPGGVWTVNAIVDRYGVCITRRTPTLPVSFFTQLKYYLFQSGEFAVGVEKYLLDQPDFTGAFIFPRVSFTARALREDRLLRFVQGLSTEGRFVTASGKHELAFIARSVRYEDATNIPLIYHPETPYTTGLVSITNRVSKADSGVSATSDIEYGVIVNYERIFPVMRSRVVVDVDLPFRGSFVFSAGSKVSSHALPLHERFHIGGIPFLRGVRYPEFAGQCDAVPMGCDHYVTAGLKHAVPFRDDRVAAHVFLNGGFSVLTRAKISEVSLPVITGLMSYGAGLTVNVLDRVYEANVAGSLLRSPDLPFVSIQIGIDSLSSKHT